MTDATMWPDVLPGWFLIRAEKDGGIMKSGQYGLGRCNDPDIVWTGPPQIDPPEDEDNQWSRWATDARACLTPAMRVHPMVGWRLVEAAKAAGYSLEEHGDLDLWLWDHLGKHMKRNEGVFHGEATR